MNENGRVYLLDDLSRVSQIVEMPNGRKVRVRALSDLERRMADMEALRLSATLVEKLKDPTTPEYQSNVLPLVQGDLENMRAVLVSFRYLTAAREAQEAIQPDLIPFPDNASEDERREVVTRREKQDQEIVEKRKVELERKIDELKVQLDGKGEEELRQMILKQASSANGNNIYNDEVVRQTVYLSCEKEEGGGHFFKSIGEVHALHRDVLYFLYRSYTEVDRVDPFTCRSPSVTEPSTA